MGIFHKGMVQPCLQKSILSDFIVVVVEYGRNSTNYTLKIFLLRSRYIFYHISSSNCLKLADFNSKPTTNFCLIVVFFEWRVKIVKHSKQPLELIRLNIKSAKNFKFSNWPRHNMLLITLQFSIISYCVQCWTNIVWFRWF